MNRLFMTLFLALAVGAANAQDILNELRRDQSGQGKIVVNQSQEIEQLVNAKPQTVKTETTAVKTTPKSSTTPAKQTPQDNVTVKPVHTNPVASVQITDTLSIDTITPVNRKRVVRKNMDTVEADAASGGSVSLNRKVMRHAYKRTGYRVQVYNGGNTRADRQKCQEIAAKLKASYPNLPIYVHFYSPSWKCRAGNFTDKAEADKFLARIKAMGYKSAVLVKGTINVQY